MKLKNTLIIGLATLTQYYAMISLTWILHQVTMRTLCSAKKQKLAVR